MSLLRVDKVSKQYRLGLTRSSLPTLISQWLRGIRKSERSSQSIWALRDVSFDLESGDTLAVLGPNGAGKSTLLKLLANITQPTRGRVEINGSLSALIELGAGFHPELTGRENVYLNGAILGLRRRDMKRRFDEIVAFAELEAFIDTPVKRYSSGMAVRLGFAVATCIEPQILLIDEVLAVGDAAFRQKCLSRVQTLVTSGTSILFVSHNLYMLKAVCRQALYLDGGRVLEYGDTESVLRAYENAQHERQSRELESRREASDDGAVHVEIVRVHVGPVSGGADAELRSDRLARVDIDYLSTGAGEPSHAEIHFIRSDGVVCCMLRTSLAQAGFALHRRGRVTAVLDPLQLTTGRYHVEVGFLNASDSVIWCRSFSDWFSVRGATVSNQQRSGVFEPQVRWHHADADSSGESV